MNLSELQNRLMAAKDAMVEMAAEVIIDEGSQELIELNKERLLNAEGVDGQPLPEYANLYYGMQKFRMNSLNMGRWDMNLTGNSWDNMKLKRDNDSIEIYTDGKAQMYHDGTGVHAAQNRAKGNIFGVSESDKAKFRQTTLNKGLVARLKRFLGLKI